jgi:thiamine transport system ATP-binding protein
MSILSVIEVSKAFGKTQALSGVSFDVDEGEIVVLLGPSGCGKSTLLSIIAGLELPDDGDVLWKGSSVLRTPPHLRGFGLMFQDFALFPHMNVYANISFGLKMAHLPPDQIDRRVSEMLELVGLPGFFKRDVNTLSGGEQQRVALARALAPHPQLLMLDEPLGSLDRNLRERLVVELKVILHRMQQTAIYVTHDQEEAFTIADRIILVNSGRIEQIGTPQEIYSNPLSLFVARFLEMSNFIPAQIQSRDGVQIAYTSIGSFAIHAPLDGKAVLLLRPDMALLESHGPVILHGKVNEVSFRGSRQRISILVDQIPLTFEFPSQIKIPGPGGEIILSFDPATAIKIFPAD